MSIERCRHPLAHDPAGILTLIRFSNSAMSLMTRRMLALRYVAMSCTRDAGTSTKRMMFTDCVTSRGQAFSRCDTHHCNCEYVHRESAQFILLL